MYTLEIRSFTFVKVYIGVLELVGFDDIEVGAVGNAVDNVGDSIDGSDGEAVVVEEEVEEEEGEEEEVERFEFEVELKHSEAVSCGPS